LRSPTRPTLKRIDGREILNFGRQAIPTLLPGHRLNSGPFGAMGVGMPFALAARAAKALRTGHLPARRRLVRAERYGARHRGAAQKCRCCNGGWTADPERNKPGRDFGYTRYDKMAEALGRYAEYVEEPEAIHPASQRAWAKVEEGMVGFLSTSRPTTVPAPRRCASPAARPEGRSPHPEKGRLRASLSFILGGLLMRTES
jgi:hypothetical protein